MPDRIEASQEKMEGLAETRLVLETVEMSDEQAKRIQRGTRLLVGLGFVQLLVIISMVIGYFILQDLRTQTLTNRETGFKNRAVNCQILHTQGQTNPSCEEQEVTKYYDTNAPRSSASAEDAVRNRRMNCRVFHAVSPQEPLPDDCAALLASG